MANVIAVVQVEGLPEVKELVESLRSENAILRQAVTTQRVIDLPSPASGELRMCMICAEDRPWGVWSPMGAAVCLQCRNKARGFDNLAGANERLVADNVRLTDRISVLEKQVNLVSEIASELEVR